MPVKCVSISQRPMIWSGSPVRPVANIPVEIFNSSSFFFLFLSSFVLFLSVSHGRLRVLWAFGEILLVLRKWKNIYINENDWIMCIFMSG